MRLKETEKRVDKEFRFGESKYGCTRELEIPVWIKGEKIYLRTFVVEGDIPWLIGRTTLQKLKVSLDLERDVADIKELGMKVQLRTDRVGHLRIALGRRLRKEEVWGENLAGTGKEELRRKLRKLHLQFGHVGQEKLIELLEDAGQLEKNNRENQEMRELRQEVKKISNDCITCKKFRKTPARPVVGLPWSSRFNDAVSLDLGEFDGKRFLVMVDLGTRYCQACWVSNKKPEEIIKKFIKHWVAIFGTPSTLLTDNGKEFQNESVLKMCEAFGINCKATAAESPWSNGKCEKMVGLLKDAMRKMHDECEGNLETILYWAVSAKNALHNQRGFSPNQLVFGRNPALPDLQKDVNASGLKEENEEDVMRHNLEAIHNSRKIHIMQEADKRLKKAMKNNVREHKLEDVENSDEVYYKRDGEQEWRGPAKVIGTDGKTVVVKHGGSVREIARVHITRLIGAKEKDKDKRQTEVIQEGRRRRVEESDSEDESDDREENRDESVETQEEGEIDNEERMEPSNLDEHQAQDRDEPETEREHQGTGDGETRVEARTQDRSQRRKKKEDVIQKFYGGEKIKATAKETDEEENFEIINLAAKRSSKKWGDTYNMRDSDGEIRWVNLRDYKDIREIDEEDALLCEDVEEIREAKEKEFQSWKVNDVYEEVPEMGQKTISLRWVITDKIKDGKKICKARLVARGYEEKDIIDKDAPTCAAEGLRLCLTIMAMKRWKVKTLDVKTAYLQGESIDRELFVKPPKEANTNGLWKLKKTIYGLKDAAKAWHETVNAVMEKLGGERSIYEPTIFSWKNKKNELIGIMCVHVDDFCFGGSREFEKVISELSTLLKVGEVQSGNFTYVGINICEDNDGITLEQENYIKKIEVRKEERYKEKEQMTESEITEYRGLVGKLNWVTQCTRPDFSFDVSQAGRSFQGGRGEEMIKLIKTTKKMKKTRGAVRIQRLQERDVYWEVYCDASLGNVDEGKSQIGYIISLKDETGKRCPIFWKSVRAKRVARSATDAEALSLIEAAEMVTYLNHLWIQFGGKEDTLVIMKTDNKPLELALKSRVPVKGRSLRIDIAAIKEVIKKGDICVGWVSSEDQIADALTKEVTSKRKLRKYVFQENENEKRGED